MALPLVDRATGDLIPADDHNDVKDIISDGVGTVNTLSLNIGGTEVISSTRHVTPVRIIAPDSNGIYFYASDGTTQIARIDDNGNLYILGTVLSL